jgi:hypothetical protein
MRSLGKTTQAGETAIRTVAGMHLRPRGAKTKPICSVCDTLSAISFVPGSVRSSSYRRGRDRATFSGCGPCKRGRLFGERINSEAKNTFPWTVYCSPATALKDSNARNCGPCDSGRSNAGGASHRPRTERAQMSSLLTFR